MLKTTIHIIVKYIFLYNNLINLQFPKQKKIN